MKQINEYINEIICGDNVEVLREFPDECIDLTVTSPPYDNLRTYDGFDWDFEALAKELYRVTKRGGVVVWVVNDATIDGCETLTSFKQALYFKEIGFNVETMIWRKTNPVPQFPSIPRYTHDFEYMFILSKGKIGTFNPIMVTTKTAGRKINRNHVNAFSMQSADRPRDEVTIVKAEKRLTNTWELSNASGEVKGHPAVFPEKLAEMHIISWSNPGDIVLDPFVGSGTTAKMAALNDRKYIGIDISEEYCELARKRVAEATYKEKGGDQHDYQGSHLEIVD